MKIECDFFPVDGSEIKRQKSKARELRQTQWWKNLRARGQCRYCKGRFNAKDLTMDHIIPVSRGGLSIKSNIVPCCKGCNSKKKYLLPIEWQEYLDSMLESSVDKESKPEAQGSCATLSRTALPLGL